jgi:outer membrane lipoprotein-sorting protein
MKHRIALLAALLLAASAAAASAQTLDEIVTKNVEARGGKEKLKAVQSARMTGSMTMGQGMEAALLFEFKRPKMIRQELTVQGLTAVTAYNGTSGWQIMPFMGKKDPEPMSADDLKEMEEQADIEGDLVDWKEKGNKVELLGKEKIEGTDAYKLRVTLKNGTVKTEWLDADSFLEIREESRRKIQGNEVEFVTTLGDYKEIGGLLVPFSFDSKAKGSSGGQKVSFKTVEFNVPIDAARFKMPEPKPAEPAAPKN